MGQRLVISVEKDERKLCNIYYHWSGYTYSALYETQKVIDCIYNSKDYHGDCSVTQRGRTTCRCF